MEYGLYVSQIGEFPSDPRLACAGDWLHLLPPAPLRAIYCGSEFCADLLPNLEALERFCLFARDAGLEPVLLTPVVTTERLKLIDRLLQGLVSLSLAPAVVFNDWGVLNLLLGSYPGFPRRSGRLLNRGLRDPRLLEGKDASGSKGRQPGRMRSLLLQFGVEAVESDADLEGGYLGEEPAGVQRVLHFPFVAAATGRNCLIKADGASSPEGCFTKGLGLSCAALCRGRSHSITRADSKVPLWRAGNTVFYQVSAMGAKAHLAQADRVVLYERPTA